MSSSLLLNTSAPPIRAAGSWLPLVWGGWRRGRGYCEGQTKVRRDLLSPQVKPEGNRLIGSGAISGKPPPPPSCSLDGPGHVTGFSKLAFPSAAKTWVAKRATWLPPLGKRLVLTRDTSDIKAPAPSVQQRAL